MLQTAFDIGKFLNSANDLELTNGMAFKYVPAIGSVAKIPLNANASIFKVKPGELTRWYIVNAGPNHFLAFHFHWRACLLCVMAALDPGLGNRYGMIDRMTILGLYLQAQVL